MESIPQNMNFEVVFPGREACSSPSRSLLTLILRVGLQCGTAGLWFGSELKILGTDQLQIIY